MMRKKILAVGKLQPSKGKRHFEIWAVGKHGHQRANFFLNQKLFQRAFKFLTANTKFLRSKIGEILLSNYWLLLLFMVLTCRNWVRYWVLFQFFYRDFYRDVRSLDNTISNYDVEENICGWETTAIQGETSFWNMGGGESTAITGETSVWIKNLSSRYLFISICNCQYQIYEFDNMGNIRYASWAPVIIYGICGNWVRYLVLIHFF